MSARPCHGVGGTVCAQECLDFDASDVDAHTCTCGHPRNRHASAQAGKINQSLAHCYFLSQG